MVPGLIIIGVLVYPFSDTFIKHSNYFTSIWFWIPFLGLSWVFGIAIQSIGEKYSAIKYYPSVLEKVDWKYIRDHDKDLEDPEGEKIDKTPEPLKADGRWQEFLNAYLDNAKEEQRKIRERLVVIKEATGNVYLALIISLLKLIVDSIIRLKFSGVSMQKYIDNLPSFLLLVVIIIFLKIMHNIHVNRQFRHMLKILIEFQKPEDAKQSD